MQYQDAIPLYEKAIALDPGFAMAYRGLSTAYSNRGFIKQSRELMQKALENADRISDRERLLIQARIYYQSEQTYDQAIETYDQLLKLYPDDDLALNGIGNIYNNIEEDAKALPYYDRYYSMNKNVLSCINLAGTYESLGRSEDRPADVYEDYLKTDPNAVRIRVECGRTFLNQGRYDEAMSEAEKALLAVPNSIDAAYLKADTSLSPRGTSKTPRKNAGRSSKKAPRPRQASLSSAVSMILGAQGRHKNTEEEFGRILALVDEMKNVNARATSNIYYAHFDMVRGRTAQALEKVESSLKIYRDLEMGERIRQGDAI